MTDPRSFGAWLRRERERRSITLRAIADRTKIGVGLLEALERGDVSRWPGGIYRRAFVRSYAEAVGLDADLVVANFERVFPSDPSLVGAAPAVVAAPPSEEPEMRLSLVTPAVGGVTASALRIAARDVGAVLGLGVCGFLVGGAIVFWATVAAASMTLHLSRVLGLSRRMLRRVTDEPRQPAAEPRASVVSFPEEQVRATSRRARARRMLADLSAAASSAAMPNRRRAARS